MHRMLTIMMDLVMMRRLSTAVIGNNINYARVIYVKYQCVSR